MRKNLFIFLLSIAFILVVGCSKEEGTSKKEEEKIKIGYSMNFMSHEFYQNISKGAKQRAEEKGVEFIPVDANMDSSKQISDCEILLSQGIKALIITPVDAKLFGNILKEAEQKGVKIITESNAVEGTLTLVGINSYESGKKAGLWYGKYAKENNIVPKILIIGSPAYEDGRQRVAGFKDGIASQGINYEIKQEVDGKYVKDISVQVATDALTLNKDVNMIFGVNDDSTTGAIQAYKAAGLDENNLVAVSFGFEGAVGRNALLAKGPYKAALAMFPENIGKTLIDTAMKAISGEKLEKQTITANDMVTLENFNTYYIKDGESYKLNLENIEKIGK